MEKRPENILHQLMLLWLSLLLAVFMLLPGSAIQARSRGQTQEISVEKIWLDAEGEEMAPGAESIEAALLRNGEIYDTVVLGPDNDWHSSWILTDLSAKWSVREVNAPEGFTSKVDQSGLHFTITNTKKPDKPEEPDDPDPEDPKDPEDPEPEDPDPQKPPVPGGPGTSAQMQWQIPVLGMLAALLVFFLTSERQKKSRTPDRTGRKKSSGKHLSGKHRHIR